MKKILSIIITGLVFSLFGCINAGNQQPEAIPDGTMGETEISRGTVLYDRGCYKPALDHFFRAHELFVSQDQLAGAAMSLNNMGNVYRATGDAETAVLFYTAAYDNYRLVDDRYGLIQASSNKAAALMDKGEWDEAEKALQAAEKMVREENIVFTPLSRNSGILLIRKRDYQGAEAILRRTLSRIPKGDLSELAATNYAVGNLMMETKKYDQALTFFQTALDADRKNHCNSGMAQSLEKLATVCLSLEKMDAAYSYFQRCIMIYALSGNRDKTAGIMKKMEELVPGTGRDLTLTRHFVEKWLAGKAVQPYCE